MTFDFQSIKDPLDEAMRTRFICSVDDEAILKALFKLSDDELTFTKSLQVTQETEEAARVAKEMVYGPTSKPVYEVQQPKGKANPPRVSTYKAKDTPHEKRDRPFSKGSCGRCGKKNNNGCSSHSLGVVIPDHFGRLPVQAKILFLLPSW